MAPPCAMVIFGAAGDLTKRLVVPALYNLATTTSCPTNFGLSASIWPPRARSNGAQHLTDAMRGFVAKDGEFHLDEFVTTTWQWLTERMSYMQGDLNDPETYRRLGEHLAGLDKTAGTAGNRLFYLAVADRFFSPAVAGLGAAGLTDRKRRPMAPGHHREAVRSRPPFGQGAQRRDPKDAAGAADLSDRPFPRQGNGAEHHGAALCQRLVRAALEPRSISTMFRSPRRRRSASSAAASSTRRPARCATWCPTTCSSCWR